MSSSFWYHIYYESSLGQGIERTLVPGDWTCDSILFGDWGLYFDGYDIRRTDGKIAFIAGEGSMEGLCVANSDGSGVTRIREEGYEGVYIWDSPRWSPDGTKIAFHGYAESTVWLFVVNGTTGALESYFNFGGYYVKPYAWSPDGRYVLVGVYGSEFPDSVELWKVNPSSPETDYAYICGRANIWDADWGNLVPSGIENERNKANIIPIDIAIKPNPAGQFATIAFSMPKTGWANVEIYDLLGRQVRNWHHESIGSGRHTIIWDGKNNNNKPVPPGTYFLKIFTPFGNGAEKVTKVQ